MRFSWKFLEEFLELRRVKPQKLAELLTMAGLEVSEIEEREGDFIFETEVTSNRPDLLSIVGIAYEAGALLGEKIKLPKVKLRNSPLLKMPIRIKDKKDCLFYVARIIRGVKVEPSPSWLKERVINLGINSVNNIVDVTNYCMLKWGQPLHAFDLDKIEEALVIRRAYRGERLLCIDNKERELSEEVLVIADKKRPLALAGIIGGKDSEVTDSTENILIEAAIFSPLTVRRGRRFLGIESESSYRFERGLNGLYLEKASSEACQLILELGGGKFSGYKKAGQRPSFKSFWIKFDNQNLNNFLGTKIKEKDSLRILKSLNFVVKRKKTSVLVKPPLYRQDIKQEVDLVEEVSRLWGYQRIEESLPPIIRALRREDSFYKFKERLKNKLLSLGFSEVVTFSIISEKENYNHLKSIKLINPLRKEESILRPELFLGLVKVFQYNVYRKEKDLEFFEIANSFLREEDSFQEKVKLALGKYARTLEDFYFFKAKVESFLKDLGIKEFSLEPKEKEAFSNYACLEDFGWIGILRADLAKELDLEKVFLAEFDLEKLYQRRSPAVFEEIVPFPWIERDISLAKRKDLSFREIEGIIKKEVAQLLKEFRVIDIYQGEKIPPDFIGFTLRIFYQHSQRTLSSEEVDSLHFRLREALAKKEGVILR